MPSARPEITGRPASPKARAKARGGIAAADHRDAVRQLRQLEARRAEQIEHQRWIGGLEQRRRVARVAERHDAARGTLGLGALEPFDGAGEQGRKFGRHAPKRLRLGRAGHLRQCLLRLRKHLARQAEGGEQRARRDVPDPGRQRKAQPVREFIARHAKTRPRIRG
jgi:hypothetical protein